MSKCLVLGGNGFLGSHLVDSLVERGHNVRVFDRLSGVSTRFNNSKEVEVQNGDFMNSADVKEALKGVEYVFHFISTTTPASAENDPVVDVETNIKASIELFQACVESGVKRVIFASTGGAIYGAGNGAPHKESDMPEPVSPYAIGKLTIEHYLRYFRTKFNLDSVTLRISNPYGERQPFGRRQGVIPIFIENICQGRPIQVMGDGSMVRDYIYVKDVASAIAAMFDKRVEYDTYNLGSGEGVSVSQLVDAIAEVSGENPSIEQIETPKTFVHKVVLDTTRFESEFGKVQTTSLYDGVATTYQYIKDGLGV